MEPFLLEADQAETFLGKIGDTRGTVPLFTTTVQLEVVDRLLYYITEPLLRQQLVQMHQPDQTQLETMENALHLQNLSFQEIRQA
ncbi:hypothetical protein A4F85_01215 [Delftia sp. GW456-R20]|nr:hypothetical protein A4F85_01215 [Delftia sp. GW456-R20]